jgi:hypothetical protein
MPITSITIENFKGIATPVTIPIRPLTLLFGKNSAGKSTILQALHYLREILENRRPDPDHTQTGGEAIDLGGFASLVHRNEMDRQIRIRVAMSLDDDGIPNNGITSPEIIDAQESGGLNIDLNNLGSLRSSWIEVTTTWEPSKGAYISEYAVGMNDDELVRLRQNYGLQPELIGFNFDHNLMFAEESDDADLWQPDTPDANKVWFLGERFGALFGEEFQMDEMGRIPAKLSISIPLNDQDSIIPDPDRPFPVNLSLDTESYRALDSESPFLFWSIVGQALTGPLSILLQELRGIRYLGPIRQVPPRNHRTPKTPEESRWASGLAAWDALSRDASLVEKTNHYIQDVLKLGYSIHQEQRISIDAEGEIMAALRLLGLRYEEMDATFLHRTVLDPLEQLPKQPAVQLHDETNDIDVDPSDIGVGVSQVLPVVVGALDKGTSESPCRIFAVEQPELHVHPAVQVALGDLFIDAVTGTERSMLIETHSEHLLLRLLRRVRETGINYAHSLAVADLSVVYVQPTDAGILLTPLEVTEDGDFDEPWPEGFFDERDAELF